MREIVRVTKNDYGIDLTYTVRDENGQALDISTASDVILHVGRYGESTNLIDGTMAFVTDGSDGKVKYTIASGSFDTEGYYDSEIEIQYSSGRRTTRTFTLHVLEEL